MPRDLPSTVLYPDAFVRAQAAGADGVFNWDWAKGRLPRDIKPMDFDGVVVINHFLLIAESKDPKKDFVPAQKQALMETLDSGLATLVLIFGKLRPEAYQIWTPLEFSLIAGHPRFHPRIRFPIAFHQKTPATPEIMGDIYESWGSCVDRRPEFHRGTGKLSPTAYLAAMDAALCYQQARLCAIEHGYSQQEVKDVVLGRSLIEAA